VRAETDDLLTAPEAAALCGITKQRLHQLRQSGRFIDPLRHIGGRPVWLRKDVLAWNDTPRPTGRPKGA
jgi:predicted DNA-binding transcriptional regulator AlpA